MPINENQANWSALCKLSVAATRSKATTAHLISRWRHWEEFKGTEWLVNRIKALNTMAKLMLDNRMSEVADLAATECIRVNPETLIPLGPEGRIVQNIAHGNAATQRKNMLVLRTYTGLFLKSLSKAQLKKAKSGINDVPQFNQWRNIAKDEWALKYEGCIRPGWFKRYEGKKLQLPTLDKLKGLSSYPGLATFTQSDYRDVKSQPYEKMVTSLFTKGFVPESLLNCVDDRRLFSQISSSGRQLKSGDKTLGRIVAIQEGGAKGRVICSPNAWVQYYMYPLHQKLMEFVYEEEDTYTAKHRSTTYQPVLYGLSCVTNQARGIYTAIDKISNGSYAASVDLSSATDRFPLDLQQDFLRAIGLRGYASAFNDLRGPYTGLDNDEWFYNTGQPMGIYGSFPLFHLTHLFLLRNICKTLGLDPTEIHFCVLGDDVIIFNRQLHNRYREVMEKFGVSISEHKSFHNNLVEFAGCIIPKHGKAFRPYKHGRNLEFGPLIHIVNTLWSDVKTLKGRFPDMFEIFVRTTGMRDLVLQPLCVSDPQLTGVNQHLSKEYFSSLVNKLESTTDSSTGLPIIPPGLSNSLVREFERFFHKEPPLGSLTFDPSVFEDRNEWHTSSFDSFMKDHLNREVRDSMLRSNLHAE